MSRPSSDLANDFRNYLQSLENVRAKMETLFSGGHVTEDDIEHVYSGLFLDAFTAFESLIEQLFISLLIGEYQSNEPDVVPRAKFTNYDIAQGIILGERSYVDWLPFETRTLKRADAFFENGFPFNRLKNDIVLKPSLQSIERFAAIRNAIAHKSKHSQLKFEKEVSGNSPLSPRQKKPAGYLRSSVNRTQVQYQVIANELNLIAHHICK